MNKFDEAFELASASRRKVEDKRDKLSDGLKELNALKKSCSSKQKELIAHEEELNKLKGTNKELKSALVRSLIDKEELQTKKRALTSRIEQLSAEINRLECETDLTPMGENVEHICHQFSSENQLSLINRIEEAKCKLKKLGVVPDTLHL